MPPPRSGVLSLFFVLISVVLSQPFVRVISSGDSHTCSVQPDNKVFCWGLGTSGQLGNSASTSRSSPVKVTGITQAVEVCGAESHSCVRLSTGEVQCFGQRLDGRLGNGVTTTGVINTPLTVSALGTTVSRLRCMKANSCILTTTGGVRCWGKNQSGQVGISSNTTVSTPATPTGYSSGVFDVGMSWHTICVITTAGGVLCAGYNGNGGVGDGTNQERWTMTSTGITSGATFLAGGNQHNCALVSGAARCWGNNFLGQLGNGNNYVAFTPMLTAGWGVGVRELVGGTSFTCAVFINNTASCFGQESFGQFGRGAASGLASANIIIYSAGATNIQAMSAGSTFTCVQSSDRSVRCVGQNTVGQLGKGTTSPSNISPDMNLASVLGLPGSEAPTSKPSSAPTISKSPTTRAQTLYECPVLCALYDGDPHLYRSLTDCYGDVTKLTTLHCTGAVTDALFVNTTEWKILVDQSYMFGLSSHSGVSAVTFVSPYGTSIRFGTENIWNVTNDPYFYVTKTFNPTTGYDIAANITGGNLIAKISRGILMGRVGKPSVYALQICFSIKNQNISGILQDGCPEDQPSIAPSSSPTCCDKQTGTFKESCLLDIAGLTDPVEIASICNSTNGNDYEKTINETKPTPTLMPTPPTTFAPTSKPTLSPTGKPSSSPTRKPSSSPTRKPSLSPTTKPTLSPTRKPSSSPTVKPSSSPTVKPSSSPTRKPSLSPTTKPTLSPTRKPSSSPTVKPSSSPTVKPTSSPTVKPSSSPTRKPSSSPTVKPSSSPTVKPSSSPTVKPSSSPTSKPSSSPTVKPTSSPTVKPSSSPTVKPSSSPTTKPTESPTVKPTESPTTKPTDSPTTKPTSSPSNAPTFLPTESPTTKPTESPTVKPTESPTTKPSSSPTVKPSSSPTVKPTESPTVKPTESPTAKPTDSPTTKPSSSPSNAPTFLPTSSPTVKPSSSPTVKPSSSPTVKPTSSPTVKPTSSPTVKPSSSPTVKPTSSPTVKPSSSPTRKPSSSPTMKPSSSPTVKPSLSPTTKPSSSPTTKPSLSPSKAPTTSKPTANPTTSNPTATPTTSNPTSTPTTSKPTNAPSKAPTQCTPGTVTCCIATFHRVVELYVNEVNITSSIIGDLTIPEVTKRVTFPEPVNGAAFAIKAYNNDEVASGTLQVKCTCTRPGCTWNFETEIPSYKWFGFRSSLVLDDGITPDYYLNNYVGGGLRNASLSTQPYAIYDGSCGTIGANSRFAAIQGVNPQRKFWAFRRFVEYGSCGTPPPSNMPTPPTTFAPSRAPSKSPGCIPATVTCCLTAFESLRQVFVNEVNLTLTVQPQNALNNETVVKFFSFSEPVGSATIAFKGYEKNELRAAGAQLRCTCTRAASNWNFIMDNTFRGMKSDTEFGFPEPKWWSNAFLGGGSAVSLTTTTTKSSVCGNLPGDRQVSVDQGYPIRDFWVLRKNIASSGACTPTVG